MANQDGDMTLKKLLSSLKGRSFLKNLSPIVEEVMSKVDRANYTDWNPYHDKPNNIGYGATISAPHMHAFALEILKDRATEGAKVLDIGSGSGYLTACLALMVGERGRVYGIEHIRQLVELAEANIRKDNPHLLESGRVTLVVGDGREGLPEHCPYDVIHVGATASEMPTKLVDQLKEGGIMVLPIQRGSEQKFEKVEKLPGGKLKFEQLLDVRYVPLTDPESQIRTAYP